MNENFLYEYKNNYINSLIFKLTDFCNQGCNYCYREDNLVREERIMSDEIIYTTIEKYVKFLKSHDSLRDKAYMIWHGGEPLLAGIDKFKKIMQYEKEISEKYDIEFLNSVQTNGTLINEEWADFFEVNNFLVGFSLDGPKKVHDIDRKDKGGNSSFDKTLNAINLLKNYNIRLNIISVITNKSYIYVDEIYNFIKSTGVKDVDFIPCFWYEDSTTLKDENYSKFMKRCLKLWEQDNFKPLIIRFLSDVFDKIVALDANKGISIGCELAGSCGQNFSIGVKGEVCPCECLTPINSFYIGNIMENTFEECVKSKELDIFKSLFNCVSDECFKCEVLDVCSGGCFNRRLPIGHIAHNKDLYCNTRKDIIQEIKLIVNKIKH
jgi:uncharacterized protein